MKSPCVQSRYLLSAVSSDSSIPTSKSYGTTQKHICRYTDMCSCVVPYRMDVGICESEDMADTRQRLSKYFISAINTQANMEEILKAILAFSSSCMK
jgi:hypothetical protein